jgi:vesicle coat complex subunit
MNYSHSQLSQLARDNPQKFIEIANNQTKTDIKTISMAIDVLGEEIHNEAIVLPIIRRSLKHIHVMIRESAIICAASFYSGKQLPQEIVEKLKAISINDPSPDIKELATNTLKDFNI